MFSCGVRFVREERTFSLTALVRSRAFSILCAIGRAWMDCAFWKSASQPATRSVSSPKGGLCCERHDGFRGCQEKQKSQSPARGRDTPQRPMHFDRKALGRNNRRQQNHRGRTRMLSRRTRLEADHVDWISHTFSGRGGLGTSFSGFFASSKRGRRCMRHPAAGLLQRVRTTISCPVPSRGGGGRLPEAHTGRSWLEPGRGSRRNTEGGRACSVSEPCRRRSRIECTASVAARARSQRVVVHGRQSHGVATDFGGVGEKRAATSPSRHSRGEVEKAGRWNGGPKNALAPVYAWIHARAATGVGDLRPAFPQNRST